MLITPTTPISTTTPATPITVLVVDNYTLVHVAISQILISQPEIKHVVSAQNYVEAEKQASQLSPEIIWLDLHMAHSDSITEIGRLRRLSPTSRIMALVDVEDEQEAFAALMEGAQGYRSKQDVDPGKIMSMIQMLCRNEFVLRPTLLTRLIQRLRNAAAPLWDSESETGFHAMLDDKDFNGLAQLTTREREILQLISQGYRDRDTAQELHISEKTVQKHVQSILSKLRVQNRTQAAYLIHSNRAGEKNMASPG